MKELKIALCQMQTQEVPGDNLKRAVVLVAEAAAGGAEVVALPEMFLIPYDTSLMKEYASPIDGGVSKALSAAAAENGVLLIAGSVPELGEDGSIYNTCLVFAPDGSLVGKYRKMHLFDIDIKGRASFRESDVLSPGEDMLFIEYRGWTIAVAICFDVRFSELFRIMALEGVQLVVIPAAFALATGEMHWDLTMRSRAMDNQLYLAAVSPARNPDIKYQPWGHSLVSDPWGKVITEAGTEEDNLYAVLDSEEVESVREQLPILKARRVEKYATERLNLKINRIKIK